MRLLALFAESAMLAAVFRSLYFFSSWSSFFFILTFSFSGSTSYLLGPPQQPPGLAVALFSIICAERQQRQRQRQRQH